MEAAWDEYGDSNEILSSRDIDKLDEHMLASTNSLVGRLCGISNERRPTLPGAQQKETEISQLGEQISEEDLSLLVECMQKIKTGEGQSEHAAGRLQHMCDGR